MANRFVTFLRNKTTGAGINAAPWSLKRHVDDTVVASGNTDSNGRALVTRATAGYAGPVYATLTSGGETKIDSGQVIGQVGDFWLDDIPDMFAALGVGVISGLAVSATGASMSVSVSAGSARLVGGLPFVLDAAGSVGPHGASHATLERKDRVVLRASPRGAAEAGKIVFAILAGANAAVGASVAPALTQDATTWEFSLAQVLISPSTSTIAAGKVTDERYSTTLNQAYSFAMPTGLRSGDLFRIGANGQLERLAVGSNGQMLVLAAGLPAWSSTPASHSHLTESERGYFHTQDSNSTTTSTTATDWVSSFQLFFTLPTGTWTVDGHGTGHIAHSGVGGVARKMILGATDGTVFGPVTTDAAGKTWPLTTRWTGVPAGLIGLDLEFQRTSVAGTVSLTAPFLEVNAFRTA